MTYNWNTMVEITVPTGTNGWLYSGEVIINGVKVRFPVGVPTSVPEPAAVLLKKMIELEQEEDANTAKPQNHYVGDVTIPAGKTLTLEKGAKFVGNSGGSSGGGNSTAPQVVILPETAPTQTDEGYFIEDVPSELLMPVRKYNVMYNGTAYKNCTPVLMAEGSTAVFALGNLSAIGMTGGDPEAPFVVAFNLNQDNMSYMEGGAVVVPLDGSTPTTLSITRDDDAEVGLVTAFANGESLTGWSVTFDELVRMCEQKHAVMLHLYKNSMAFKEILPLLYYQVTDDSDSRVIVFGNNVTSTFVCTSVVTLVGTSLADAKLRTAD